MVDVSGMCRKFIDPDVSTVSMMLGAGRLPTEATSGFCASVSAQAGVRLVRLSETMVSATTADLVRDRGLCLREDFSSVFAFMVLLRLNGVWALVS